ncbi:hypothetical protein HDA40_002719 [Hamadaea flava]|uniref:Zf-HC2 domain-containing protein n=1 Tax=Hamadaea flava TaxID=1742688 RepID=A0ABV8LG98_9ACTN|nr:hypothetical protein [Hamadaea flava]MCP2324212.1 hypothetical protein [Hamadaea flava]
MTHDPHPNAATSSDAAAHPSATLLAAYAAGTSTAESFQTVDQHVDRCGVCRTALGRYVPQQSVEAGLSRVLDALDAPRRSFAERMVIRIGVPEHMARLALATPLLRRSWLLSSAFTLLLMVFAARLSAGDSGPVLLLAAAPLIPLAGVALSYGPSVDPMYELGLVLPLHSLRLILFRSVTVLVASTALTSLMTFAFPAQGIALFGWLVPSLAVTLVLLSLSAHLNPMTAAWTTGAGWLAVVVVASSGGDSLVLTVVGQVALLAAAGAAAGYLAWRRDAFERLLSRPA